jgi:hypothetical protein
VAVPQDPAPLPTVEKQLKNEYGLTRVGNNGAIIHAGDILVIKQGGIVAIPASYQGYFGNTVTKGARIQANGVRLLEVGNWVYVTNIEVKDTQVVFSVQSCLACDPSSGDYQGSPLRASLAFQFPGRHLAIADFKDIQGVIGEVFAVDKSESERVTKLRSERNYTDIKLGRTKQPVRFADITLKLISTDVSNGTYTVDVVADDKLTVKKDKRINEPVEFYTSRGGHTPYQLVINQVTKDQIIGYLSTPKVEASR